MFTQRYNDRRVRSDKGMCYTFEFVPVASLIPFLLLSILNRRTRQLPLLKATPKTLGRLQPHHRPRTCHTGRKTITTFTAPFFVPAGPIPAYDSL
jgi:hypothetical protein